MKLPMQMPVRINHVMDKTPSSVIQEDTTDIPFGTFIANTLNNDSKFSIRNETLTIIQPALKIYQFYDSLKNHIQFSFKSFEDVIRNTDQKNLQYLLDCNQLVKK
jgi:hypothetical protein